MSNINLPLILTIGVFGTGLIWLLDALWFSRPRKRRLEQVDADFAGVDLENDAQRGRYETARDQAGREPVLVEYSKSFFPVLAVVFVLRSFVAEPFQIPSASMEPSLEIGDFILVNKFTYGLRLPVIREKVLDLNEPERGDVMVFFPPHLPDTYYIKRVIGLPGDDIRYIDHRLYVNGEPVPSRVEARLPVGQPQYRLVEEKLGEHDYTTRKYLQPGRFSRQGQWTVPQGHYFMMGDNRDNSFDSRGWEDPFVPEKNIVGKAELVWMHWESLFSLPSFDTVGTID